MLLNTWTTGLTLGLGSVIWWKSRTSECFYFHSLTCNLYSANFCRLFSFSVDLLSLCFKNKLFLSRWNCVYYSPLIPPLQFFFTRMPQKNKRVFETQCCTEIIYKLHGPLHSSAVYLYQRDVWFNKHCLPCWSGSVNQISPIKSTHIISLPFININYVLSWNDDREVSRLEINTMEV